MKINSMPFTIDRITYGLGRTARSSLALFLTTFLTINLNAQVVINEILPDGTVELKNIGAANVDVSGYWLCDFPAYQEIQASNIICGSTDLAPGEILAVDDFNTISSADGEMGLYSTDNFSNSNAIVDYVEWGSPGHTRSSVAIAAGIWSTGDFVAAFGATESLEYDGGGDSSSDWGSNGSPTICSENSNADVCDVDGGTLAGGPFSFCVGDGEADMIPAGDITLNGNSGTNSQWVVTDDQGNILGLPPSPDVVDFNDAGAGTCLVWHLSYEDGLVGLEMGMNAGDLEGCFDLSNSIAVERNQPDGGTLAGGPFSFCVGDGMPDMIEDGSITLTGNSGMNSQWVVTDDQGNILGLPPSPDVVDFDGAGPGTCLIWHLSYADGLVGLEMGMNAGDLDGCFDLSNSIAVERNQPEGGTLAGGPFTFCVGDGIADMIPAGDITLTGNSGMNSQWVVTDDQGNILGLPPSPDVVDFDGAGSGTCLVWHLSYEDGLIGLEMGMNAGDLEGCFDLSNSIAVERNQPEGGDISIGANYVVIANRASGSISVIDSDNNTVVGTYAMPNNGEPMYAVYNSENQTVLVGDYGGKVVAFDAVTFEVTGEADAGAGVFHMWASPNNEQLWVNNELDFNISVINPTTLANIATVDLPTDLFQLGYKPHDVIISPNNEAAFVTLIGGTGIDYVIKYETSTFTETARAEVGGDPHVSLTSANDKLYVASQESSELKVLNRSDLSEATTIDIPNAHGLGMNTDGTYLYVGNISDGGTNATYTVDLATNMLVGGGVDAPFSAPHNYAVSAGNDQLFLTHSGPTNNTVSVYTIDPTPTLVTSLTVENNPFGLVAYSVNTEVTELTICAGDGESDAFDVVLENNMGTNSQWVITDDQGNILALPANPPFDLDGAGPGTCLIWHLSYEDGLTGLETGLNAGDLTGCFNLSNPITVVRNEPVGGTLTGGPFSFCVGDGIADMIPAGDITLNGNSGTNSQWVVTDDQGNILGLPPSPDVVDFDDAGAGTCLVWHLSYEDGLIGLEMGMNAGDLEGCFSLSNSIAVERNQPEGGELAGGPFSFCVGDGIADMIPAGAITLTGNSGMNSQWVVTDDQGNILGLPPSPDVVDFEGAGIGTCLVWHLSYEDGLVGLEMGLNAADFDGCFDLSNSISVFRDQPMGGTLTGGPFSFCVGDGIADMLEADDVILTGNSGMNSQWVVTDDQGNILGLPPSPEAVDFDGAGAGTCFIWHLSHADGIIGLEMGLNAGDLEGCFDLSNSIAVERSQPEGGELAGGPFSFCVGDGEPDMIPAGAITLTGNSGTNSQWVVTDDLGNILGLPPSPDVVDFDDAGAGTCLVWHLSYEDGLVGLEMGMNAADLEGCFSLSNSIAVERNQPEGGELAGGPFSFCVGDGEPDMIPAGAITLTGNSGTNSQWVVTDDQGNILGLPPSPDVVDFDDAGAGTCLVWHLSYADGLVGLEMGMNAADLEGCFSLSNSIAVERIQPEGGELEGGPFSFCVGDGVADMIPAGAITLTGNSGMNSAWIVTDDLGNILGLPPSPDVVDFDDAGAGTCLVWHISYEDGLVGLEMGMNAADLEGCFSLSNSIAVERNQPEGGELAGGPFSFCVGDGEPDMIPAGAITLTGNSGTNSQWVVTDDLGNILGLPPSPDVVDFDDAGAGTCLVWHLSYEDGLVGLEMDMNAADLEGCFSLSNSIAVERSQPEGGELTGGPFSFCVGDGVPDMLEAGDITLAGNSGMNSAWIVTDDQGNILGLPPSPEAVDFDDAGAGTCLVWHISYDDGLVGLEMGMNAADLEGCFSLSNSIPVERIQPEGGELTGGPFTFCVGDGVADMLEAGDITLTGNSGMNSQWVVTDEAGNILGLPPSPEAVDFEGSGTGVCLIWHLSYEDGLVGLEVDMNAGDLEGCFSLSNSIEVERVDEGDLCISSSFDVQQGLGIDLYPNPVREVLTLEMENMDANQTLVSVIDASGKTLIFMDLDRNQDNVQINVSDLAAGLYLIQIRNGEKLATRRFVIAN